MSRKKPERVEPRRSTRKKYDIPIDPEVAEWSKQLFHPVKPIIEGLKGLANAKNHPDIMSEADNLSAPSPLILAPEAAIPANPYLDTDIMSDTATNTDPDIMSDTNNFLAFWQEYSAQTSEAPSPEEESPIKAISNLELDPPRHLVRSIDPQIRSIDHRDLRSTSRSDVDLKSASEIPAVQPPILSEYDNKSESVINTAKMQVPHIKGELRIPNYLVKGLLCTLSNSEFVVYLWLYFLSYGFNKTSCYVSAGKLAEAVNLTDRTVFRTLNSLETRGLIRRSNRHFLGKAGGLTFDIFLPDTDISSGTDIKSDTASIMPLNTSSDPDKRSYNKDHDHDLKKKTDHALRTMMIYQELTNNSWTPTDELQYLQIKDLPIESIEKGLKIIHTRAAEPIRSFAYFAKSLLVMHAATQNPKKASPNRAARLRMQEAIKSIIAIHVGGRLSVAELEEAVRIQFESRGLNFDKALFNELVTTRRS